MDQYAGECFGGPYAGKKFAHHSKVAVFQVLDGNPLKSEICIMREGQYEWKDSIWLWSGPSFKDRPLRGG